MTGLFCPNTLSVKYAFCLCILVVYRVSSITFAEFDDLFRDLADVREAVKKELARNSNSKHVDTVPEDEEELVSQFRNYFSSGCYLINVPCSRRLAMRIMEH